MVARVDRGFHSHRVAADSLCQKKFLFGETFFKIIRLFKAFFRPVL
jgi:hypothetical protein